MGGQTRIDSVAFAVAINEDPEVIVALIDKVKLNSSSSDGWMPLHIAARYNSNPSVIEKLIDEGSDPDSLDFKTRHHCIGRRPGTKSRGN